VYTTTFGSFFFNDRNLVRYYDVVRLEFSVFAGTILYGQAQTVFLQKNNNKLEKLFVDKRAINLANGSYWRLRYASARSPEVARGHEFDTSQRDIAFG